MLPEMEAAARMWFTPEYNLAVNRKSLDEHLVGNMGLEKNGIGMENLHSKGILLMVMKWWNK